MGDMAEGPQGVEAGEEAAQLSATRTSRERFRLMHAITPCLASKSHQESTAPAAWVDIRQRDAWNSRPTFVDCPCALSYDSFFDIEIQVELRLWTVTLRNHNIHRQFGPLSP